jgi:hypothetical protein
MFAALAALVFFICMVWTTKLGSVSLITLGLFLLAMQLWLGVEFTPWRRNRQ